MGNLQLFAKGGLVILIIVSLAILIERLTDSRSYWVDDSNDESSHIHSNNTESPIVDIGETVFAEKFSECLAKHSESEYYPINHTSSVCIPHGECMHNFVIDLSRFMESFGFRLLLLEPSLLFCLLPSSRKYNLITRGFNPNEVQRSRNVITFGIYQSDVKTLEQVNFRRRITLRGYRILKFSKWINSDETDTSVESFHYFIIRQNMMMHLIVLNPKATYLWSPGFNTSEISSKGLQYVNDRVFENFNVSLVHVDILSSAQIFLPFDTRCFLLDLMSSNFMECKTSHTKINNMHTKIVMALKELKSILASQMVIFWLWSKTLQGWFEKCDILHYSEELKFSVAAKSVYGYNFTSLFADSECKHIESNFNLNSSIKNVKLNCHGVPVELNFMYEDKVTYWYEYVDEQNIYRLKFPRFSLCSTDAFGLKIGIPCETNEIFEGEYGEFLKNTTLSLNPENMMNVQLLMHKT